MLEFPNQIAMQKTEPEASFSHLGFISDPLIVSKFHNETHDPKGQENKIYTIVKYCYKWAIIRSPMMAQH